MEGPFTEADALAAWKESVAQHPRGTTESADEWLAILNAAYRSAASRPDGWVACPKEPGAAQIRKCSSAWSAADAIGVYRAMLAASPYAIKEG